MPGIAAILLGALAGVLLAGAFAAVVVNFVPASLRGPGMLWGVTAAAVALSIWLTTRASSGRG
jgi:hypothetical protein